MSTTTARTATAAPTNVVFHDAKATESIAEWLDINGDGLSDKLYRDSDGIGGELDDTNRDGPIRYRLNTSGPDRDPTLPPTFGEEKTVTGISKLSTEGNFGIEGAFEAFPGVTVAFGLGAEVSWGDAYFSDANADGLPDYVSGGKVWFNHLDALLPDDVAEIQQQLAASNRGSTPCAGGPRRLPARSRSSPR